MKKLTLDRGSRVFRAYRWSLGLWQHFTDVPWHQRRKECQEGDNLCHFVRVMVLGVPTVIATQVLTWAFIAYFGVYKPCAWFGWWPYLRGWLWVAAAVAAIVGTCVGMSALRDEIRARRRRSRGYYDDIDRQKIGTFTRLGQAYARSKLHEKICPLIEFSGKNAEGGAPCVD